MTPVGKLNPKWITKTKKYFLEFLEATDFPMPMKSGKTGYGYLYPEWMIMLISILAVKCKIKTYMGIHRMTEEYWPLITDDKELPAISERQLRDRLKKICFKFRKPPAFIFQIFPEKYLE